MRLTNADLNDSIVMKRLRDAYIFFSSSQQRDVIETSRKDITNKEQVTSMVSHNVIDNVHFEKIDGPRVPDETPKKITPDRPGYPRGIPGLREEDKPKSLPAAGKPSRPRQPEDTRR